ncbi:MAG: 3-isopropylmalate dehydrogenase [Spirochaetes bacterium]|nr:3-isopropylmalate dehydrogenase [Spirochaetota bacterium]
MQKMIAVLEGDGIGPEIVKEGVKVLNAIENKFGHKFNLEYCPFGASAYFSDGSCFPEKTKSVCDEADAIIKGPVGLAVTEMNKIPQAERPEIAGILPLRERYDTFANYRPVYLDKSYAEISTLKEELVSEGIDIMMIRELVGGIYFGKKVEGESTGMEYSTDECTYKRKDVERIAHVAFREAQGRNKIITNVHKSNVLATSRFWNAIVEEIAKNYSDVQYNSILVDNVAFQLVKNPRQFNGVMLLENMQGDIITDQAGGLLGTLGLMPSACVGPDKGYVEPAHGSAPDIAGKNIANPYSMIGSVAFMLEKFFDLKEEASLIWDALKKVLKDGYRSSDIADKNTPKEKILSTADFGNKIAEYIK